MTSCRWGCIVLCLFASPLAAQYSAHSWRNAGTRQQFLTSNQTDTWAFDGEAGETILAEVSSTDFDPVLELVHVAEKGTEDKTLISVDDSGNRSQFAFRLSAKGKYSIQVRAFRNQGGGNYKLSLERFQSQMVKYGQPATGTLNRQGKSYLSFTGKKGEIVRTAWNGEASDSEHLLGSTYRLLDPKGRQLTGWQGSVQLVRDGMYTVVLNGTADHRFDAVVRLADQRELPLEKQVEGKLAAGETVVWNLAGKPGDFRLIQVEKEGRMLAQFVGEHQEESVESAELAFGSSGESQDPRFVPLCNRNGRIHYAVVLQHEGKHQLQLLATTAAKYQILARDPSQPLAVEKTIAGKLPVAGAEFFTFAGIAGRRFQVRATSDHFVPVLTLFNARGELLGTSNESNENSAELSLLVLTSGACRLKVSSVGDGGGGNFQLSLTEPKVQEIAIGERATGTLAAGGTDYWSFTGKEGQTVFISARSLAFTPQLLLRNPDGLPLNTESVSNTAIGGLLAVKLAKAGRYTLAITSPQEGGTFSLRVIDGE